VTTTVDRPSTEPAMDGLTVRRWPSAAVAGVIYLAVALFIWRGVWSTHPSSTSICGCGDAARFLWFFDWPAFAIAHGHNVLYSPWLFHPTGINLLNDTSVLALGLILAPVTLAFGPVASMNVALTLTPFLSALAMFVLLRRWVRWEPAAFVGGLVYGFSPFVITELALTQLNIAFLAIPPLVVLLLDELLVRQRHSAYRAGAMLALLLVVQFFVSTEVLVITVLFGVLGVLLVVAFAGLRQPGAIGLKAPHALRGITLAVGVSLVLLAYPLWFLLRGPAHLSGPIWSNGSVSQYGNTLTSFWKAGNLGVLGQAMTRFGGYQGPALPGLGYLGLGVVVVALAGLCVWRHDRRLLLFGGLGVVAAVLSLGPGHGYWVPWTAVERVPWIGDIVEIRFTVVLSLCASVMVAIVIDRLRRRPWSHRALAGRWATVVAGVVAVAMLVPTVIVVAPTLPFTTTAVAVPSWFARVGKTLPAGRVVLAYPVPFSGLQSSQAWQALDTMRWAQAGGGGPQGQPSRAGTARPGFEVLVDASLPLGPAPQPTTANLLAVRSALAQWRVTTIVVPDQETLPLYERGRSSAYAVAFFTAAMGRPPAYIDSAWVWSAVSRVGGPVAVTTTAFNACVTRSSTTVLRAQAVPSCILGS
jgi:hypothetical protein